MGFQMVKYFWLQVTSKGQGQTIKTIKSNISKTVRDREKKAIEVTLEVMYGLSNSENIFDSLKDKDQGQTLKTLKPNISKTVPDWSQKKSNRK